MSLPRKPLPAGPHHLLPTTIRRIRREMQPVIEQMLRRDEVVLVTAMGMVGNHPWLQALGAVRGRAWLAATNQRLLAVWLSRTSLTPDGYEEWEVDRLAFSPWRSGVFPGVEMSVDGVVATSLRFQLAKMADGVQLIAALAGARSG